MPTDPPGAPMGAPLGADAPPVAQGFAESRVFTELRRPLRAVPLLRDVLGRYNATHTRELALYLSWLAVAYADAGEPEEAAAIADRVISLSADVAGERTAERVRVVPARLAEYAEVPEVGAVLDSAA
ncbi:hypothetical protein ACFXOD_00610 [Streptomyces sp. NPDC059161]|uniref:hypothetical protein n=1 Tax=Streptomyces sp. NPDC059161 TaxID=3346749 RepID=UPI0036773493